MNLSYITISTVKISVCFTKDEWVIKFVENRTTAEDCGEFCHYGFMSKFITIVLT